jgi:hypothetical protein
MDLIIFGEADSGDAVRPQSIELIRREYETPQRGENMTLTSLFVRPEQKRIIDGLAALTGRGKGQVLRAIIDEWCAAQLDSYR